MLLEFSTFKRHPHQEEREGMMQLHGFSDAKVSAARTMLIDLTFGNYQSIFFRALPTCFDIREQDLDLMASFLPLYVLSLSMSSGYIGQVYAIMVGNDAGNFLGISSTEYYKSVHQLYSHTVRITADSLLHLASLLCLSFDHFNPSTSDHDTNEHVREVRKDIREISTGFKLSLRFSDL
jgi:hypothetical protein